MNTIKIAFVDFWHGFKYSNFYLYKYLSQSYNLVISDKPDYVFCSVFGSEHTQYNHCIKICYSGENTFPNFNVYDYEIGSIYLDYDDRYLRLPQWLSHGFEYLERLEYDKNIEESLAKRKFCNFIYSNSRSASPFRKRFFCELSKYKRVDSGGSVMNNIGYKIENKIDFIKNYKFTIAMENSQVLGYTTEKIIDPILVNSMPIYWGDTAVKREFNTDSFINVEDFSSVKEAIEYILYLDENDEIYLTKLNKEWFAIKDIKKMYTAKIDRFFKNIFECDKKKAKKLSKYGYSGVLNQSAKNTFRLIQSNLGGGG